MSAIDIVNWEKNNCQKQTFLEHVKGYEYNILVKANIFDFNYYSLRLTENNWKLETCKEPQQLWSWTINGDDWALRPFRGTDLAV